MWVLPSRAVRVSLTLALGLLSIASLFQGVTNAVGETGRGGSNDLYSYWAPGRWLLSRSDPYAMSLRWTPTTPGGVLDANTPATSPNPANTPLMLVFLSPLALLPWDTARCLWAVFNLGLALFFPWAALRLVSARVRWTMALICLAFYSMLPTRNVIANGQTTLLVAMAALLAVHLAERSRLLAGILLGLALSKYTLTLPIVVWFLARGNTGVVVLALGVQLLGWLTVGLTTATPLWTVAREYLQIAAMHAAITGDLDLLSLIGRLGLPRSAGVVASAAVVGMTLLAALRCYRIGAISRGSHASRRPESPSTVLLLATLLGAALLAIYHRVYDAVVVILVPVALLGMDEPGEERLRLDQRSANWLLRALVTLMLGVFILPRAVATRFFPSWDVIYPILTAGATLLAWGISMTLLWSHCRASPRSDTPCGVGTRNGRSDRNGLPMNAADTTRAVALDAIAPIKALGVVR